jgi:hypothetical protein
MFDHHEFNVDAAVGPLARTRGKEVPYLQVERA